MSMITQTESYNGRTRRCQSIHDNWQ